MIIMELNELIKRAEQENENLNDYGDIPSGSYQIFKELIEGIKRYIES